MEAISVITPKAPAGDDWTELPVPRSFNNFGYPVRFFCYAPQYLMVLSAVEVAHEAGELELGPEYHISISRRPPGRAQPIRCTRNEARFVLRAFGMQDADEDNHVPGGVVRNFWMPVADKYIGHVCPCKDTEPAMVEDKGDFVWRGIDK